MRRMGTRVAKRATNVSVRVDLLAAARAAGLNLSATLERASHTPFSHLTPVLDFEGDSYLLMTPQLAGVARTELGQPAGSLAGQGNEIVAAMDFMLTGF